MRMTEAELKGLLARSFGASTWTVELLRECHGGPFAVIITPETYMMTIDFGARCFRRGISTHGKPTSTATFGGRGWKQALIGAAVRALDELRA